MQKRVAGNLHAFSQHLDLVAGHDGHENERFLSIDFGAEGVDAWERTKI